MKLSDRRDVHNGCDVLELREFHAVCLSGLCTDFSASASKPKLVPPHAGSGLLDALRAMCQGVRSRRRRLLEAILALGSRRGETAVTRLRWARSLSAADRRAALNWGKLVIESHGFHGIAPRQDRLPNNLATSAKMRSSARMMMSAEDDGVGVHCVVGKGMGAKEWGQRNGFYHARFRTHSLAPILLPLTFPSLF